VACRSKTDDYRLTFRHLLRRALGQCPNTSYFIRLYELDGIGSDDSQAIPRDEGCLSLNWPLQSNDKSRYGDSVEFAMLWRKWRSNCFIVKGQEAVCLSGGLPSRHSPCLRSTSAHSRIAPLKRWPCVAQKLAPANDLHVAMSARHRHSQPIVTEHFN
jgi:hypothetical protein